MAPCAPEGGDLEHPGRRSHRRPRATASHVLSLLERPNDVNDAAGTRTVWTVQSSPPCGRNRLTSIGSTEKLRNDALEGGSVVPETGPLTCTHVVDLRGFEPLVSSLSERSCVQVSGIRVSGGTAWHAVTAWFSADRAPADHGRRTVCFGAAGGIAAGQRRVPWSVWPQDQNSQDTQVRGFRSGLPPGWRRPGWRRRVGAGSRRGRGRSAGRPPRAVHPSRGRAQHSATVTAMPTSLAAVGI